MTEASDETSTMHQDQAPRQDAVTQPREAPVAARGASAPAAGDPAAPAFDALLPRQMAEKAERVGVQKSALGWVELGSLATLAGAFIALGAVFATTVLAGGAGSVIPFGVMRLAAGVVFSLGLILVLVGGAELFTGNALIVMAWSSGRVTTRSLLRNWAIVYLGNFVGSVATAVLMLLTRQYTMGGGAVGIVALQTAQAKCSLGFGQAIALGILCNALVCLAVWLTFSARTTSDRILAIVPPISAFVACGFEHSVANMYFVPIAMLIKAAAPEAFWTAAGTNPAAFADVTVSGFLWNNLVPVTLGNIIGGALLVGAVYWLVYLRPQRDAG